jgi:hypothetical protein
MGWMTGIQFLAGAMMGFFSLHDCIQTGSGAHPIAYPMGTEGDLTLGVKQPEHEADYPPPSSAMVKNAWNYTSTPQYASCHGD